MLGHRGRKGVAFGFFPRYAGESPYISLLGRTRVELPRRINRWIRERRKSILEIASQDRLRPNNSPIRAVPYIDSLRASVS